MCDGKSDVTQRERKWVVGRCSVLGLKEAAKINVAENEDRSWVQQRPQERRNGFSSGYEEGEMALSPTDWKDNRR